MTWLTGPTRFATLGASETDNRACRDSDPTTSISLGYCDEDFLNRAFLRSPFAKDPLKRTRVSIIELGNVFGQS